MDKRNEEILHIETASPHLIKAGVIPSFKHLKPDQSVGLHVYYL